MLAGSWNARGSVQRDVDASRKALQPTQQRRISADRSRSTGCTHGLPERPEGTAYHEDRPEEQERHRPQPRRRIDQLRQERQKENSHLWISCVGHDALVVASSVLRLMCRARMAWRTGSRSRGLAGSGVLITGTLD